MPRSTVLDSWNDSQIRTMKLGGNAAAATALGVRVGMVPASAAKYDSRAAKEYKKRLAELVQSDTRRHPEDPFIETTEVEGDTFADAKSVESLVDLGRDEGVTQKLYPEDDRSTMLRAQSPVAMPTVTSGHQGSKKPPGKMGKLGAIKSNVSFDQLEAKTKEEQKKSELSSPPSIPVKADHDAVRPTRTSTTETFKKPQQPQISKDQQAAMERLGMGVRKLNMSSPGVTQNSASSEVVKSMSSDQYFKTESQEEKMVNQERLKNIQGATSVSSNQFFNQEEEEPYETGGAAGMLSRFKTILREGFIESADENDPERDDEGGDGKMGQSQR